MLLWQFEKSRKSDAMVLEQCQSSSGSSGGAADPSAISYVGHMEQLKDFIKCIKSGTKPLVDGKEGRKSVEIILAIYQSSWTGKRVSLPLKRDPSRPRK